MKVEKFNNIKISQGKTKDMTDKICQNKFILTLYCLIYTNY